MVEINNLLTVQLEKNNHELDHIEKNILVHPNIPAPPPWILNGSPLSTAAFRASARGSVSGLGGLKETKMFLAHPRVKVNIVGSLRDREVACSASDRQDSNFESCVWRTVSSQSSHHPQEVHLAQFSLYVHKGGLKPDSYNLRGTSFDVSLNFLIQPTTII